jgi:RsiW-degrading membrane proteinase PrsW (M82 family)
MQWFYLADDGPKGPFLQAALAELVKSRIVQKGTPVRSDPAGEWRAAGDLLPDLFPAPQWFYAGTGGRVGPIESTAFLGLVRAGTVKADTLVWRRGMAQWAPARDVLTSRFKSAGTSTVGAGEILGNLGAAISDAADLPTIGDVPLRSVLVGGLRQAASFQAVDTEDELAVGTRQTTPALADIPSGWPKLTIFWRILAASLLISGVLFYGMIRFDNLILFPGFMLIGSFVVPFAVVVAFFELNLPRNVAFYQVGKMLLLGGALSVFVTSFVLSVLTAAGTGALVPALLTGLAEESSKALILLIVVYSSRYPYQLNGLLFGAAVGAGFAGLESAGYSFVFGWRAAAAVLQDRALDKVLPRMIGAFIAHATAIVGLRGMLAAGGHVIWTAMVGSALWKAKQGGPFRLSLFFNPVVLRRLAIASVLHGLWDATLLGVPEILKVAILSIVGWYLILAIVKQALGEIEHAKAVAP